MREWQPIETAPEWRPVEGENYSFGKPEVILGWVGTNNIELGYWKPFREGGGEWEACRLVHYMSPPTHWMPLPQPPKGV